MPSMKGQRLNTYLTRTKKAVMIAERVILLNFDAPGINYASRLIDAPECYLPLILQLSHISSCNQLQARQSKKRSECSADYFTFSSVELKYLLVSGNLIPSRAHFLFCILTLFNIKTYSRKYLRRLSLS